MIKINIGTRGSALALKQTQMVIDELKRHYKNIETNVIILKTIGDKITDKPLYAIGKKGVFINDFENALKEGIIDIAVHSGKDIPSSTDDLFCFPSVLKRGDLRDALITKNEIDIKKIKCPVIGTSSPRRSLIIRTIYNCEIKLLRGNINTRLLKLKNNEYDAIILAMAGIERLYNKECDLTDFNINPFEPEIFIPAACQGIIVCECLKGSNFESIIREINDNDTHIIFNTERKLMSLLNADCHDAAGVYAFKNGDKIHVSAFYKTPKIVKSIIDIKNIDRALNDMAGEFINV